MRLCELGKGELYAMRPMLRMASDFDYSFDLVHCSGKKNKNRCAEGDCREVCGPLISFRQNVRSDNQR